MDIKKLNLAIVTKVDAGESWYSIARRISVSPQELAVANGTNLNEMLHPGRLLLVPGDSFDLDAKESEDE